MVIMFYFDVHVLKAFEYSEFGFFLLGSGTKNNTEMIKCMAAIGPVALRGLLTAPASWSQEKEKNTI